MVRDRSYVLRGEGLLERVMKGLGNPARRSVRRPPESVIAASGQQLVQVAESGTEVIGRAGRSNDRRRRMAVHADGTPIIMMVHPANVPQGCERFRNRTRHSCDTPVSLRC